MTNRIEAGTIIAGTLRSGDLLEAFSSELETLVKLKQVGLRLLGPLGIPSTYREWTRINIHKSLIYEARTIEPDRQKMPGYAVSGGLRAARCPTAASRSCAARPYLPSSRAKSAQGAVARTCIATQNKPKQRSKQQWSRSGGAAQHEGSGSSSRSYCTCFSNWISWLESYKGCRYWCCI